MYGKIIFKENATENRYYFIFNIIFSLSTKGLKCHLGWKPSIIQHHQNKLFEKVRQKKCSLRAAHKMNLNLNLNLNFTLLKFLAV